MAGLGVAPPPTVADDDVSEGFDDGDETPCDGGVSLDDVLFSTFFV